MIDLSELIELKNYADECTNQCNQRKMYEYAKQFRYIANELDDYITSHSDSIDGEHLPD